MVEITQTASIFQSIYISEYFKINFDWMSDVNSNLMLFDFSCSVTVKESGKGRGGRAKAILIKIITYHSRIVEFGKQGLACNKFYVPNIHYIINPMDIFCSINVLIQTK